MDVSRMRYSRKKRLSYPGKSRIIWVTILVLLVLCCLLDVFYYKKIQDGLLQQSHIDLEKENDTARNNLLSRLDAKQEWLEMIAAFCDVPDGSGDENWWAKVKQFSKEEYRLEIGDTKGNMYFGDYQSRYVGDKPYYQEIMAGKRSISRIQQSEYEDRDSIVIGVPILRNGEVRGAVCAEYTVLSFGSLINNAQMDGYGASVVFTAEGRMVASYSGMEEYDTIYDMLETMEFRDKGALGQLKSDAESGEAGHFIFYKEGSMHLLCYQPVGIRGWTIASMVAADSYEKIFREIRGLSVFILAATTLLIICAVVLTAYVLKIRKEEIERVNRDALTGVFTREAAIETIRREFEKKDGGSYRVCMFLDIDHFKGINDTHGHDAGDKVLKETGDILKKCMRSTDIVSRYGGDEFCIWVYGKVDDKVLCSIADRILEEYRSIGKVSVSIGIASVKEGDKDYKGVMKRADQALYKAKRQGRNQYVLDDS